MPPRPLAFVVAAFLVGATIAIAPRVTLVHWFGWGTFLLEVAVFVVPKGYRAQFAAAMLVSFGAWCLTVAWYLASG
jgi:hypothetical protein